MLHFASYTIKKSLPDNFHIVYSFGGKCDSDRQENTQTCYVLTPDNSENLGNGYAKVNNEVVRIVCDGKDASHEDYLQIVNTSDSFGILVH